MTSVCEQAAVAIIADIHRDRGKEAALQAIDDMYKGLIWHRRLLTNFRDTAEWQDARAHEYAGIIAEAIARNSYFGYFEEPKRGDAR